MKYLAKLFAIDICAYAVMSNHFHIVLKVNSTADWSEQRVLLTWAGLFDLVDKERIGLFESSHIYYFKVFHDLKNGYVLFPQLFKGAFHHNDDPIQVIAPK